MKNVKTNQMNACRCNSEGAGVKMTSWLNNNFKLLALTLLAMLSSSVVWGANTDVVSGTAYTMYESHTGWSHNTSASGTSSNYIYMYKGKYITSPQFTQAGITSVVVKCRKFSSPSNASIPISIIWIDDNGEIVLGTVSPGGTSLANQTLTVTNEKQPTANTTGYIKIQCLGAESTSATKCDGISHVTINYTAGSSCSTKPTVSSSLSNTSSTTSSITATVGITSIGGCDITENGLVYSTTNPTPTVGGTNCSKETVTACGSTAANKTVTISGLACGQSYYVCGYATNAAGTRYSNVSQISTSACPVDHFIDNVQETDGYTGDGKAVSTSFEKSSITLLDKAAATSGSCEEVHYHFVGWVTAADRSAGNVDAEHIVNFQDSGNTPTGTTYYAVWAKEDEE